MKFSHSERLHKKKDFNTVLSSGTYLNSSIITIVFLENPTSKKVRLGLITKKDIGSAVIRNKVKRRLREIFRINMQQLKAGVDLIFIPKPPIVSRRYKEIEEEITSLLKANGLFTAS